MTRSGRRLRTSVQAATPNSSLLTLARWRTSPKALSHCEAASLPLVGLTAWDCLVRAANVQAGQKVLIHAGAGGVGTVAIQLAKQLGAQVATTCSARNLEFVKQLGADLVIDYNETRFEDVLSDYDVVLESLGGEMYQRSLQVLRRGGHLTSINTGLPAATARYGPNLGVLAVACRLLRDKLTSRLRRNIKTSIVVRQASGANLTALGALVDEGAIRAEVARVFKLEDIADAHRASQSGHTRGKNVIEVWPRA